MNALCIGLAGAGIVAAGLFMAVPAAAQGPTDPVRIEAEALANAASREFGAILERESGSQGASGGAQADDLAARPDAGAQDGPWAWYQRSRREFQVLMQMLASGRPAARGPLEERPIEERESVPATVAAISGPVPRKPEVEARDGGRADKVAVAARSGPKSQPEFKPAHSQERQSPRSADPARVAETKPSGSEGQAGKSATPPASAPGRASSAAVAQTAPKASKAKPKPKPRRTRRSTPGWIVVRRGDTLSAIARRHYGSARFTRRIYAANRRRIRSPHLIYPRQRIYLPRIRRRC